MTRNLPVPVHSPFRAARVGKRFAGILQVTFLLAGGAPVALAQKPAIATNGVVNAASGNASNTTVVAGSEASVYGTNLATSTANFGGQPIPTTLGGASVNVGGYPAHLYYASSGQLNIQIPWEVAGQSSASLTVTTAGGTSDPYTINLAAYAPALFSLNFAGSGPGLIFNSNGSLNCNATVTGACPSPNPANPGSIVVITATNLGPAQIQQIDGNAPNGNLVPIANTVSVTIGASPARVVSAQLCGGAPPCPTPDSTYLIYVQVPNVSGTDLPVVVTEAGTATSNTVTMNVASQSLQTNLGNPCNFGDFQPGPVQIPLQASGGGGAGYTWSVATGSLPTGLATRNDGGPNYFPPGITTGILGVATAPGNYTFTLQVADNASHTATSQTCSINILTLAMTDPNQLADGLVNSAYTYNLTAVGNTGSVTWSVPGNNLPPGLHLNGSAITGTPSAQGNFGFSLSAQDSTGTVGRFFNLQVFGVGFSGPADLGNFNQGSTVSLQLNGAGGTPPYSFNGCCLPPGLNLSSSGAITGTITGGDGTFRFNVGINDHNGNGFNKQFAMNVAGTPTLPSINVAYPIEDASVGESRNFPLNVNGGQSPYTWSISAGSLPPGMRLLTAPNIPSSFNLGPDDAVVTGSPTGGSGTFTVSVKDSSPTNVTVSIPVTINVKPLAINYPNSPVRGVPYSGYIQPFGDTTNTAYVPAGLNWTILDGTLPQSLELNTSTGTITGTPTENTNSNVFMQVTAGTFTLGRYIGFNIQSPTVPSISFNNGPSLPDATVNNNYNANVNVCCAPNGVSFAPVGSLPNGLNLNSNGNISGTPTAAGPYTLTIKATDNNNVNNYGIGIYTLNISPFQINTPTPPGNVGVPYSTTFTVSGNSGALTFTLGPGSQIPPGLSVFPSTPCSGGASICGTPTSAGSFPMNATVRDTGGNSLHFGFTINVYPASTLPPPSMNFGNNFGTWSLGQVQFALHASGGNGTYTWSIVNGSLPTGVIIRTDPPFPNYFNGAVAGLVGVATAPGNYAFTIAVTSAGQTAYQYCTWRITALDVKDGGNLPPAFVGVPYSYTFTALNAAGPVTWNPNNPTPAPGLTFSSAGVLSGTPTQAGNFNSNGYVMTDGTDPAFRNFNLSVYALRFTNSAILSNVQQNGPVNATFTATGGTGPYTYSFGGMPCCLNPHSDGTLTGNLNGVGNFGFNVTVTDSTTPTPYSYTQQFSIDAIGDPAQLPSINLGQLQNDPIAFVGGYISWSVCPQNGGTAPFTWNVTGLPPGVSFRGYDTSELTNMPPGCVEIWGTPTAAAAYPVTYKVTDFNNVSASVTSTVTVSRIAADGGFYPPNGTINQPYSVTFRGLGGTPPYSVSHINGIQNPRPDGVGLQAGTLTFSGTPLEDGNFNPDFLLQDSVGNQFVIESGFNIASGTNPQITINDYYYLGNVILNSSFGHQLNSCCVPSNQFTYTVDPATLPPGISLSASGAFSGTATKAGIYSFLVKSADFNHPTSNAGYKQMVITVTTLQLTASTNLPFGNVGTLYNYQIPTSGGSGVTFQFIQGSLPPGINTLSSTGVLSGTPTATGQFPFSAYITDTGGDAFIANFNLSIYCSTCGPAVGITTGANLGTVPIGAVQIPLTAAGGIGTYTWSVTSGSLPPGLSLRTDFPQCCFPPGASAGIIGVAATGATANPVTPFTTPYNFTLTVTSGTQSYSQAFTLTVTNFTAMENYGLNLPDAFVNTEYAPYTITPLNKVGAVTFSNPNQVPPGMSLSSAGVLSGTPSTSGFYNFGFTMTDAGTGTSVNLNASVSVNIIQVTGPGTLTPNAIQGQPYSYTFTASGGTGCCTFNVGGLPNGLSVDSNTGILSGTVNSGPGRYYVRVTATDGQRHSYSRSLGLDVVGVPPALTFITTYGNLDDCNYGLACSRGLQAYNGGVTPFHWVLTGLPPGMDYRSGSGVTTSGILDSDVEIWGSPLQTGTFSIKAVLTDSTTGTPLTATQTFPLHVSPMRLDVGLPNGTLGVAYSQKMRVLGGTPAASDPLYGVQIPPLQLPEGLTLSGMTVSGNPVENGSFSPQVTFTDSANPANTLTATMGFNIGDSGTSTINANTIGFADSGSTNDIIGYYVQGSNINYQLNACCAPSYQWTKTGGNLPAGVSLGGNGQLTGTIGTSNAVGAYTFTVQVADAGNTSNTGVRQYTIFVTDFGISTNNSLPFATVNKEYPLQPCGTACPLQVSVPGGGTIDATFKLAPGTYMPPGLQLSLTTGQITGTPTATGQYNFAVIISNNANPTNDVFVGQYNLSVWATVPPLFLGTGPTLGPMIPGFQTFQLTASGGVPPYNYSVTPGFDLPPTFRVQNGGQLPQNFSLPTAPATSGGLLGVADTVGTYNTSLRVMDSATPTPAVFDRPISMILSAMTIPNSNNPPAAYVGTPYSFTFVASGGSGTYSWSVNNNNLPQGLSLGSSTGTISGTPQKSGTFFVGISLKDTTGTQVNFGYNLTVYPFDIKTGQILPQGAIGQPYSQSLDSSGCGAGCTWSLQNNRNLPQGLSLNSATGVISGTPTNNNQTSWYNNWVTVQAKNSGGAISQKNFSLMVPAATPQPLFITNGANLNSSPYGNGYTMTLSAQGGKPPYTWSVPSGSNLPAGISLLSPGETLGYEMGPGFAYLVGRPLELGSKSFTLQVSDSASPANTATETFNWLITPISLSMTNFPNNGNTGTYGSNVPAGTPPPVYGQAYSQQLLVIGGPGTFTSSPPSWTTPMASNPLPPGLTVDQSTGIISGTPGFTQGWSTFFQTTDTAGKIFEQFINFNAVAPTSTTVNLGVGNNLGTYTSGGFNTFNLNPTGGTGPYTITVLDSLPPGCSLQTGDELLQNANGSYDLYCSYLASGTFTFTLKATDSQGNYGVRVLSITVVPQFLFTNQNLGNGSANTVYSEQLLTWDNSGTVSWALTPGSALPPGMTLSAGGALGGTPSTAGNYAFALTATDSATNTTITYTFNINVSTITIANPRVLPNAIQNTPYSYQFTATGGGSSKTWTANGLPNGMSISSANGLLSGTPMGTGNYGINVSVTDGSSTVTHLYELFVQVPQILTFPGSPVSLPDARLGQNYQVNLGGGGGVTPQTTWALAPDSPQPLPAGLKLNSGSSLPANIRPGLTFIGGEPSTAGQYTFDLIATDSNIPASIRRTFTLNVSPLAIQPGNLPIGVINTPYSVQLEAVGGDGHYTYTYSPTGIDVDMFPPGVAPSSSGLISGTPTSTGAYNFNVTVTDGSNHTYTTSENLIFTNANGLFSGDSSAQITVGKGLNSQSNTNENSTYTWSISNGTIPPGLTLSPSGQATGAPSTPGTYTFTVTATDNANPASFTDGQITVQVSPFQLARRVPPSGTVGTAYPPYKLPVTGGTPPYQCASSPLQPLPAGLNFESGTCILSGTPTDSGVFSVGAFVTDSASPTPNTGWVNQNGLVLVNPGETVPLQALSIHTHGGSVGVPFADSSVSVGYPLDGFFAGLGVPPYTYTVASGSTLPPGLTILPGANGVPPYLGGIPTTPGKYTYSLLATDSIGQTAVVPIYTVIKSISALPAVLPNGAVGSAYSAQVTASGGTPPYTYGVGATIDGQGNPAYSDMPPGLTLSSSGVLSGTPTESGTFNVVVFAQDSEPDDLLLNYTVVIDSTNDPNTAGTAQGIGISPASPIQLNYVIGGQAPTAVPINVTATSGTLAFNAMVSGISGATLSSNSGTTPYQLTLNLNTAALTTPGTYSGVVGIYAPNAVNFTTGIPVQLIVTSPPPCVYTLSPSSPLPSGQGPGIVGVTTGSLCSWTATTTDSFITINSGAGTGNGTVSFSVSANTALTSRTGSITVNGSTTSPTYTVTQFGSNCALAITPSSTTATAAGGTATVGVTTNNSSCAWTASGLGASPASGTGNGTVTFTIPPTSSATTVTLNASVQLTGGPTSTFTVTQSGLNCTTALSASAVEIGSSGGDGQVNVTTPAGCSYSTVNGPSWINVTSGGSGSGPGPVGLTYHVSNNSTTLSRSATLNVGGQPYTITQDPSCNVTVDPPNSGSPFGVDGGSGTLAITANESSCAWTASSPVPWITLSQPSYGTGNGSIQLTVSSNASSTASRTANLIVAGQTVAVTQGGTVCSYVLGGSNSSIPYGGGTGSVTVTAPGACHWSSSEDANASWLHITSSGSGGTSNVVFAADPNTTATARSGTLTVASQPFTVTEAAGPCSYLLSGTSTNLAATGDPLPSGSFTFSTHTTGCSTTPPFTNGNPAVSFASWLTTTINAYADGTSGTVTFTATANTSGSTRTGTIQFAGQTYTVSQTGVACAFSLNSYGLALGTSGGDGNVIGSPSAQGCTAPTTGTNYSNIVMLGTLSVPVSNIYTLPFTVAAYNSTVTGVRVMVISFGGQLFTIKQTSW